MCVCVDLKASVCFRHPAPIGPIADSQSEFVGPSSKPSLSRFWYSKKLPQPKPDLSWGSWSLKKHEKGPCKSMKNGLSTQHDWPQHTLFSASFTQRWAHAKGAWHRGSCLQGTTPFPSMNPVGFLLSSPNWKSLKRTDFRWSSWWENHPKMHIF